MPDAKENPTKKDSAAHQTETQTGYVFVENRGRSDRVSYAPAGNNQGKNYGYHQSD